MSSPIVLDGEWQRKLRQRKLRQTEEIITHPAQEIIKRQRQRPKTNQLKQGEPEHHLKDAVSSKRKKKMNKD
jgi:hypothetical protein